MEVIQQKGPVLHNRCRSKVKTKSQYPILVIQENPAPMVTGSCLVRLPGRPPPAPVVKWENVRGNSVRNLLMLNSRCTLRVLTKRSYVEFSSLRAIIEVFPLCHSARIVCNWREHPFTDGYFSVVLMLIFESEASYIPIDIALQRPFPLNQKFGHIHYKDKFYAGMYNWYFDPGILLLCKFRMVCIYTSILWHLTLWLLRDLECEVVHSLLVSRLQRYGSTTRKCQDKDIMFLRKGTIIIILMTTTVVYSNMSKLSFGQPFKDVFRVVLSLGAVLVHHSELVIDISVMIYLRTVVWPIRKTSGVPISMLEGGRNPNGNGRHISLGCIFLFKDSDKLLRLAESSPRTAGLGGRSIVLGVITASNSNIQTVLVPSYHGRQTSLMTIMILLRYRKARTITFALTTLHKVLGWWMYLSNRCEFRGMLTKCASSGRMFPCPHTNKHAAMGVFSLYKSIKLCQYQIPESSYVEAEHIYTATWPKQVKDLASACLHPPGQVNLATAQLLLQFIPEVYGVTVLSKVFHMTSVLFMSVHFFSSIEWPPPAILYGQYVLSWNKSVTAARHCDCVVQCDVSKNIFPIKRYEPSMSVLTNYAAAMEFSVSSLAWQCDCINKFVSLANKLSRFSMSTTVHHFGESQATVLPTTKLVRLTLLSTVVSHNVEVAWKNAWTIGSFLVSYYSLWGLLSMAIHTFKTLGTSCKSTQTCLHVSEIVFPFKKDFINCLLSILESMDVFSFPGPVLTDGKTAVWKSKSCCNVIQRPVSNFEGQLRGYDKIWAASSRSIRGNFEEEDTTTLVPQQDSDIMKSSYQYNLIYKPVSKAFDAIIVLQTSVTIGNVQERRKRIRMHGHEGTHQSWMELAIRNTKVTYHLFHVSELLHLIFRKNIETRRNHSALGLAHQICTWLYSNRIPCSFIFQWIRILLVQLHLLKGSLHGTPGFNTGWFELNIIVGATLIILFYLACHMDAPTVSCGSTLLHQKVAMVLYLLQCCMCNASNPSMLFIVLEDATHLTLTRLVFSLFITPFAFKVEQRESVGGRYGSNYQLSTCLAGSNDCKESSDVSCLKLTIWITGLLLNRIDFVASTTRTTAITNGRLLVETWYLQLPLSCLLPYLQELSTQFTSAPADMLQPPITSTTLQATQTLSECQTNNNSRLPNMTASLSTELTSHKLQCSSSSMTDAIHHPTNFNTTEHTKHLPTSSLANSYSHKPLMPLMPTYISLYPNNHFNEQLISSPGQAQQSKNEVVPPNEHPMPPNTPWDMVPFKERGLSHHGLDMGLGHTIG